MSLFVRTRGARFDFGDGRTTFRGINCYFLAYCSHQTQRQVLTVANDLGLRVVRSWAFLVVDDLLPHRVAFQRARNNELVLQDGPDGLWRLDHLIQTAEEFGIHLILPLVNHWEALGGMSTYVKWLRPGAPVTEFYRSAVIREAYQTWVRTLLTRRNHLTGRYYFEEPAVLAWELTNEARCPPPGSRDLLLDWTADMSSLVKNIDPNHLLALGDEGFFYKRRSGHLYNGSYGVDWKALLELASIDFGTYHLYPQDWGYANRLAWGERWIREHSALANILNKPVILEEFGLKIDGRYVRTAQDRERFYKAWQNIAIAAGTAGTLVWMLGHDAPETKGYVDDYVLRGPDLYGSVVSGQGSVMPG